MSDFPAITPPAPDEEQPGYRIKPEGFQLSDEVEGVMSRLIERHPDRLGWLDAYRLAAILDWSDPGDMTTDGVGKAKRVTGWQQALTTHRGAVIINGTVWGVLGERQREALVLHHLLHFDRSETGKLVNVGHDVEEFHYVAATYGQWQPSLRNFAEQLQLGLERGGG